MAYFLEYMEPTAESKEIHFTKDILDNCRLVYRLNNVKNEWEFYSFWDSETYYSDDDIIVPVQSVYKGVKLLRKGISFVNVIGSTGDPRPSYKRAKSWIGIIREAYRVINKKHKKYYSAGKCCTDNAYYIPWSNKVAENGKCDNKIIVGGHVLINRKVPDNVETGGDLYLLPICQYHNVSKYNPISEKWNANVRPGTTYYMKTRCEIPAIRLSKFMQHACVDRYINKYGLENIRKI